jgi:hypothetical protein
MIKEFFIYNGNTYSTKKCLNAMELDYTNLIEREAFDDMIDLLEDYCDLMSYESDKNITIDYFLNIIGKELNEEIKA